MTVCEFGAECPLDALLLDRLTRRFQVVRISREIVKGPDDRVLVDQRWEEVEGHRRAIAALTVKIKDTKLCGVCPMQGKELG